MDKKISQLGATTVPVDADLLAIVQSGITKKITFANFKAGILDFPDLTAGYIPYWDGSAFQDSFISQDTNGIILDANKSIKQTIDPDSYIYFLYSTSDSIVRLRIGLLDTGEGIIQVNNNSGTSMVSITGDGVIATDTLNMYSQTASTVPYLDASKNLISSAITPTELNYLSGATSSLQAQIDALTVGLSWKTAVRGATTTSLPSYTVSGGNKILTATSNGAFPTTDGLTYTVNQSILVKDETAGNAPNNGIYTITQVGSAGTPWILTRRSDANTGPLLVSATVAISEGTTLQDTQYVCNTDSPISLGVTNITFVAIGGTTYVGTTNRVTVTGNQIDISATFESLLEKVANKDATGGYAGLTLFKINFKDTSNTYTSFFTNSNTAARTYTFQDRNGTIADDTDLATKVTANATITGATKTKVTYDPKGLVTSGTDATTADIADSSNKRYVTDAQLTVIGNTSGTNSGDETAARIGAIVNGTTDYTTPLDADKIGIWDVANSLFKSTTWDNIKATLKAYFDTKYIMQLMHSHTSYSPLDSTTYYFNSNLLTGGPVTANANRFFTFPRAMTLKEANLMTIQGGNGSNESATIYLYNVTTGANVGAVGTFTNNAGPSTVAAFNYTGLSLNVNNTDKYSWKIATPAYATNPTSVISEFRSYWITT